jgi:hypothetical protein
MSSPDEKHKSDDDPIRALDDLAENSGGEREVYSFSEPPDPPEPTKPRPEPRRVRQPKPSPPPVPPQTPTPPAREKPRDATIQPERRFRCLRDGYPLMAENSFRCPECGTQYEQHVLERWFWGEEGMRMEHVLWMVRAAVFLKLWILPGIYGLSMFLSALAAGWACWLAGQNKMNTLAWNYALAGMVVNGLLVLGGLLGVPSYAVGALDIAAAALLLIVMLRDADGQVLYGEPQMGRMAHVAIFLTPLFAGASMGLTRLVDTLGWSDYVPIAATRLIATAVWGFVWWRLETMKRVLFAEREN